MDSSRYRARDLADAAQAAGAAFAPAPDERRPEAGWSAASFAILAVLLVCVAAATLYIFG